MMKKRFESFFWSPFIHRILLTFEMLLITGIGWAQCTNQVTVLSGVEQFNCTNVTVTSSGGVGNLTICGGTVGPHYIGLNTTGSYTFSFSNPVLGVTLDFAGFDYADQGVEEVAISIDGLPYFITDAGVLSSCNILQAEVTPWGTLRCPDCGQPFCDAACEGVNISQPINSITIEDRYISGTPVGVCFNLYFCCGPCRVDAGSLSPLTLNFCPGGVFISTPATDTYLQVGDLLQYVLVSDQYDLPGSIIATSNTPSFTFNPATMQEGVPYFMAAMAGENLNGNVDLTDPCLDFSNVVTATWWPLPTVSFDAESPGVCAGECITINANFTGTPPFVLTYNTSLSGPITQIFYDNTDNFQVCGPMGSAPGSISIQAISLKDGHCTCY